jgi:hypothetical protein
MAAVGALIGCDAPAPGPASPPPTAAAESTKPELPEGQHRIEISHDTVRVSANRAPLVELLDELAFRMGAEVSVADAYRDRTVTLRASGPGLAHLLPALLKGLDFRASFEPDRIAGVRLVRLDVAPRPEAPPNATPERVARPFRPAEDPHGVLDDDDDADWMDRDETETWSQEEALARLERGSREERLQAIRSLEPSGDGMRALMGVLREDGDPAVRAAAAEQLEDTSEFAGVQALIDGLSDPDAKVVRAAIESLEFAGDESIIRQLKPLLDHPDPDVRSDAEDAIEFLRD